MRLFAVALLMPVAFLIGRATNPTAASAQTENRVYTLLQNDVVRAPGAATRCTASVEGGAKSLFCHRSPEGRISKRGSSRSKFFVVLCLSFSSRETSHSFCQRG